MSNAARKLLPALLAGALVALSACSGGDDATPSGDGSDEKPESISYWSMWKEGEAQQAVLADAVAEWEEKTGITVDAEWQGRGVVQKLSPALNTNNVPDLVDAAYNKIAPVLVSTGQAASMQMAYDTEIDGEKVSDLIPENYVSDTTKLTLENGEPWMMPYSLSSEAVWFDAAKYPEWTTDPPQNWEEFISLLDELKADPDVAPIAIDGDIAGYNAAWFGGTMIGENGPGSVDELITSEDGAAWDAPEVLEAANKVADLAKSGYFIDGYNASKWPAQQQAWGSGEAALLFSGSWIPAETSTYVAEGFEYGSFPLPTDTDKDYARAEFVGYVMPVKSKNQKWAADLAAHVMSKSVQDAYGTQAKSLPIRADAEVSPELQGVVDFLVNSDDVYPAFDGAIYPGYTEKVFFPVNTELILGKVTGEEFVAKMKQQTIDYWESQ